MVMDKVIAGLECCVDIKKGCKCCPYDDGIGQCNTRVVRDALEWLKRQNRLIEELSSNIPCCDNCEGKTTIGERTDKCVYEIEGFDSVLYCAKRGIENCFGYRKKIDALSEDLMGANDEIHKLARAYQELEEAYSKLFDRNKEAEYELEDMRRENETLKKKYTAAVEAAAIATELAAEYRRTDGDLISRELALERLKGVISRVGVYGVSIEISLEALPSVEAEPVVHAHWVDRPDGAYRICTNCRSGIPTMQRPLAWLRCPVCGAHMDEGLEIRTCYCPVCDKHFEVRSNASYGNCPDCGHYVVLRCEEVSE